MPFGPFTSFKLDILLETPEVVIVIFKILKYICVLKPYQQEKMIKYNLMPPAIVCCACEN